MSTEPVVFVADDDPSIRTNLHKLLTSVNLSVRLFETGLELLEKYDPEWTGCIITDLRMPGLSGLELQARLIQRRSNLPMIFITGFAEVDVAVRALKAGAIDFFEKPIRGQELLDSVQRALDLESRLRTQRERRRDVSRRLSQLNDGERAVLDLMLDGHPYKSIAAKLHLSYKTVEARRARVMKKMDTDNLCQLYKIMSAYSVGNDSMEGPRFAGGELPMSSQMALSLN